ncbi:MAG: hypothetical protein LQ350_003570 [Teloschistes chrysophthalmus]|nr:MAG: hypothetical protein LQ350_003570 [Niorma chrysophthalma]
MNQAYFNAGDTLLGWFPVVLDQRNYIECRGDLPQFPLPPPYQMSDFDNLQQLCAVQWAGGKSGANAGGYCHRSVIPGSSPSARVTERREVWFSDEFTPRYDWSWSGNFYLSAALRSYCWFRCACQTDPQRENLTDAVIPSRLFQVLARSAFSQNADGSINLVGTGSQTSQLQVLPPQSGQNPPAGSCGSDKRQFCEMKWPAYFLGSTLPQTPPDATQILPPAAGNHNLTQCGSFCHKSQDCGGGPGVEEGAACKCVDPSPADRQRLGLDPVGFSLVCLAMVASKPRSGLAGRDEGRFLDERGLEYRCACNSTFVSESCCGSSDGMVFA